MESIKNNFRKEDLMGVPRLNFQQNKTITKLDILRKISSGSELREGIDSIVSSEMGALIVISNVQTNNIFQGGFKVDCKFSSKRLFELAKMDGAIILAEDYGKILYANTLLVPDSGLVSFETGIRHQAAERAAKQTGGLIIAVSQRRKEITAYYGNHKYVLQPVEVLIRRATETLQILEKHKEVFSELLVNLNVLELTNLVSVADVCRVLQRIEMIRKMAEIVNEYIIELGTEGIILRMRLREIIRGVEKEGILIMKDYVSEASKARDFFNNLNLEAILDSENIARKLFYSPLDQGIMPKGYRILGKTALIGEEIKKLIIEFKNLDELINASDERLFGFLGGRADFLKKEILKLKEQIMIGNRV
jgi:diadenylate cyclase